MTSHHRELIESVLIESVKAGTFKAQQLPDIDPGVAEFFPAFFDRMSPVDVDQWADALPLLFALPEFSGVAVHIAQALSDEAARFRSRCVRLWLEDLIDLQPEAG